jgi:predicted MPP superfamily phosphohydrolase
MRLFLMVFFLIYGGVHLYFFLRFRGAFAMGTAAAAGVGLFLAAMVVAPLLVRILEREGHEAAAQATAYVGYGWMGLLFLFFCASLVLDMARLVAPFAGPLPGRDLWGTLLSARNTFLLAAFCAVSIAVYGYFEARRIRVERLVITSPKIPAEAGRIRLVQISDVHLGLIVREDRLQRIIAEIEKAGPDLLLSTGDLVDGQMDDLGGLAERLAGIKPRYGKIAVTGNHEFYAGINQALDFTRSAGFSVLRGETVEAAGISVAGVDDPAVIRTGNGKLIGERDLLGKLPGRKFTLLLKHRPVVEKESAGLFDLQLSGHVHRGQIFPFRLVTRLFYPMGTGYSALGGRSAIYVSRGTGTWGPPIRFMAPPEITVIDLMPGDGTGIQK